MTDRILKATHAGELIIGETNISCSVLENGARVLSLSGIDKAFGGSKGGRWSVKVGGHGLPRILQSNTVKSFISEDLMACLSSPIEFKPLHGGRSAFGHDAALLPQICEVILDAEKAGALKRPLQAKIADILLRGFARVGIIALVDEATGYQEIRDKKALAAILDKYLRKELAAWAKKFPDEFYKQLFRLRDWNWSYLKRPAYVGKLTNDVVYERITPGLLEELKKRSPKNEDGKRKGTLQQLFTDDVGDPALAQHLHAVTGLMRAASNWDGFYRLLQRAFPKKNDQLSLLIDD